MQIRAQGGRAKAGLVVAVAALIVLAVTAQSLLRASAAGTNAGNATVTDPQTNQPLTSGGSSTSFTLKLPAGAACTGDSATGQYKVQSYMVPSNVDPGSLQFGSTGPQPTAFGANFKEPLYDTNGTAYVNGQTANATTPGGPGPIINIPTFNFAVYSPGNIPAGIYNVGIACTLGPASTTQEDKYWNVQLTFTTDQNDSPAQIHWTVTPTATTSTTGAATTSSTSSSTTSTTTHGSTTSTTTGGTTTTTTHATTTSTTTGGTTTTSTSTPTRSPLAQLRIDIRCRVIANEINVFENVLSNPNLPARAQTVYMRRIDALERIATTLGCENVPAASELPATMPASRPAQAAPMRSAGAFPSSFSIWF